MEPRSSSSPGGSGGQLDQRDFAGLAIELLESVADGFYAVDRDWRCVWADRRTLEMWGVERDAVVGRNLWECFPKMTGTDAAHRLRDAVSTGRTVEYEIDSPLAERRVRIRVCPLSAGITGIGWRDITEQKRAEETSVDIDDIRRSQETLERRVVERTQALAEANLRLHQSEESQRALFTKAPVPMHSLDANRCIIDVNERWLDLYGYARHEVVGRPISEFHVPGLEPIHDARWDEVMRLGHINSAERQFLKKSGEIIDAVVTARAEFDAEGKFLRTITVTTDLTARKRAEEAAGRERQLSELLVESSIEGIIGLDREFCYTLWNPAMEAMSGVRRGQLIGRKVFDVRPDLIGTPMEAAWRATMQGRPTTIRDRPYHFPASGRAGFYEADFVPLYGPDRAIMGGLAFLRDTTERRRIEEQLRQAQKMEAVGQLTGGVAHDFNNLLTVIMGNLDALQRHLTDDTGVDRMIAASMRAANRAATLTHRLLAFARRQPLEPRPVDVNKLISGMSDMLRRSIGENITIETVLAGELWRAVADPNQLEGALLNLAVNSRDAMPDGGKLVIETANVHLDEAYAAGHEDVQVGPCVMIAVSDSGSGMPKAVVEKAFEPFFTTKGIGQGTGLGLSQVYGFAKQSGGHVKIYSEVGEGTTVRLYLQRLATSESYSDTDLPPDVGDARGETVLVVEDDDDVRAYSVNVLKELGYRVMEAPNGPAALDVLETKADISLLFTDVGLPGGLNGRQLADEALRWRPDLKVLFTTGYARTAIVHQGRLDPDVELIMKPFTYAALAAKIRHVLDTEKRSDPSH